MLYSIVRRDKNSNVGGLAINILDDIPYNTKPDIDTGIESISIQVNIPFIKVPVGPKQLTNRNLKEIIAIECTKTVIFQLLQPLDISKLATRELIQ